jgi:hypothetical protein
MSLDSFPTDTAVEGPALPETGGLFVLRPEVMRHLPVNVYEGDLEEALEQYVSADGREEIFKSLVQDKEAVASITELYPNFDLDQFSSDLNSLGELLDKEKEHYHDVVELLKTRQRFFEETVPGSYSFSEEDLASRSSRGAEGIDEQLRDIADQTSESDQEKKNMFSRSWDSIRGFPRNHPIVTTLLAIAGAAWGISKIWGMLATVVPVPNMAPAVGGVINELGGAAAEGAMLPAQGLGGVVPPVGGGPGL